MDTRISRASICELLLALLVVLPSGCGDGQPDAAGPAVGGKSAIEAERISRGGLEFLVARSWEDRPVEPGSLFRVAAFGLPRVGDDPQDAELVITRFEGGVGSVDENLRRWEAQFEPPRSVAADRPPHRLEPLRIDGAEGVLLDQRGTYRAAASMQRPGEQRVLEDARGVFLLLESPAVAWAIKILGSEVSIDAQQGEIDRFVQSLVVR
jgi:hypothetical protein